MTKNVTERRFVCPECKFIYTAYKKSNRKTKTNHLKDLYCIFCKKTIQMPQLPKWY